MITPCTCTNHQNTQSTFNILLMNSLNFVVKVVVETDPPGVPTGSSNNNSFIHGLGSSIMLTCSISSIPGAKSVFKWSCSTRCLVGVEMEQTISVTLQMSGEISCAYTVDGAEYYSDPLEIIVTGM